jgi:APA family basic amino acid/polyamine antiporter
VILLITIFGSFGFVVRTATFTILLYYSIANVAAIRQPREEQIYGRIIPWLGLAGCVAMSVSLPFMVIVYGISLLAIGFVIRFFVKLTGPSAV